jgi:uncharacterized protein
MNFESWYMLPISTLIASVAMASGVEGGTFFGPIFMLGIGLPAEVAVGTALITEVFGFSSGVIAYSRKKLIDYKLGVSLLIATIPAAIVGTWLAGLVSPDILKIVFAVGLLLIAVNFLLSGNHSEVINTQETDLVIETEDNSQDNSRNNSLDKDNQTTLIASNGESYQYKIPNKTKGKLIAGIGAIFLGLLSTGLGEINGFYLLKGCRIPSKVAVATNVFVVAITALVASLGHFIHFATEGGDALKQVLDIVTFTAPGVIIGGQLGAYISSQISQNTLEKSLAVLFTLVATVMLGEYFISNPVLISNAGI